jgi:hypothetical protein
MQHRIHHDGRFSIRDCRKSRESLG